MTKLQTAAADTLRTWHPRLLERSIEHSRYRYVVDLVCMASPRGNLTSTNNANMVDPCPNFITGTTYRCACGIVVYAMERPPSVLSVTGWPITMAVVH